MRFQQAAKDRIISPDVVREAAPDVILASWCGKKVVPDRIRQRPGWSEIPAVRNNRIVEIKSPLILQPGPAALTDGLDAIVKALWPDDSCHGCGKGAPCAVPTMSLAEHAAQLAAWARLSDACACRS